MLNTLWQSSKATLLILYGRRRVGKTRLLTHWLQSHPQSGLYWVAEPSSALTQIRSFSQALMNFIDPEADIPHDFTFTSWDLAFRQLALHARERRIALFIDEVTYLIDVNPDFVGILQKSWDRWLSNANIMLALSGSQMGLMQRHLLAYDAPLYGRATAQVNLPALPYGATPDYFPNYSATERVMLYSMWGGVPAYWERLDPNKSVMENLRQNILPSHAWMIDESRILLQDFLTDLHNYVGVMRAIADEQQALGEISQRTGLSSSKASFYLSVLRDTGFVERQIPITLRGTDSRRGRYFVTDPYLRFFYRFLSANQSKLALGQIQPLIELIQESLPRFIAANTWLELCREWVLRASANGYIPVAVEEVGSEWSGSVTIDVVGLSEVEHSLVLGNCFWRDTPMGVDAIEELLRNTSAIVPKDDATWSVYYVLFSACGWTEEAQATVETAVSTLSGRRRRWQPVGLRLLSLENIDADLSIWSV